MTDQSISPEEPKNKEGRPRIWTNPEVLQKLVDNYFENEKQVTLSGLALALDIDRKTLYNYEDRDEFFHIIKKARERVENRYENILVFGDRPTGVIFALKNMGWADRVETDWTTKGKAFPTPILNGVSTVDVHSNNSNSENPEVK